MIIFLGEGEIFRGEPTWLDVKSNTVELSWLLPLVAKSYRIKNSLITGPVVPPTELLVAS